MTNKSVGFIGGGRIVRIFLEGWTKAKTLPSSIVVSDPNHETLMKLKACFPSISTTADNADAAARDIVFLAVHPPMMTETVAAIKGSLKPSSLLISLAPKVTMEKLSGLLDGFTRLARVIPNAPSIVNSGFNPVAFGQSLVDVDKTEITDLIAPLGACPEVAEEKLETYAILTARGPTYFWVQFYELLQFATNSGLTIEEAEPALEAMTRGALKAMFTAGRGREEVMNLIPVKAPDEIEAHARDVFGQQLPRILEQIKPVQ